MTGDGDERVAALSEKLWGLIEAVVEMLVDDPKPKGEDAVGKRVRELGGIIRMSKTLVSLTKPRGTAATEDEMSDSDSGPFEPGERERLLAEIERNTQHLERLLERKQAEAAARAARAAEDAQDDAVASCAPALPG